jgi:hypothetical protein
MAEDTTISGSRPSVSGLARLRVTVAYLGEQDHFAWWKTSFLSSTGRRFLERNFPRTAFVAGVTCACSAAKELHDARIGYVGGFHLFRLPHGIEQDVHRFLATEPREALSDWVVDPTHALAVIDEIAAPDQPVQGAIYEGPVRIAAPSQLTRRTALQKVAQYYRRAFAENVTVFPYFADT